jgi:hypothetical protein
MPVPEPSDLNLELLISNLVALLILFTLYLFGVWSRSYILPADSTVPLRRQFVAAIPIGLLTMGGYAKSALPGIHFNDGSGVFDFAIMLGYAIFLGMISRESLDRLIESAKGTGAVGGVSLPPAPSR